MSNKPRNNVRFIAKFENYEKERLGKKRNHVVKYEGLAFSKWKRLLEFKTKGIPCDITIQKGYTSESFTRQITDVTEFDNRVIMSW
jgi:hypothetical protein